MGYANEIHEKYPEEVLWITVSFKKSLRDGKLLSGTPTITDCTGDLYFSNSKINDTTLTLSPDTDNEETVASGQAVQFLVASGDYETGIYEMKVKCSTDSDSSPSETIIRIAPIKIIRE